MNWKTIGAHLTRITLGLGVFAALAGGILDYGRLRDTAARAEARVTALETAVAAKDAAEAQAVQQMAQDMSEIKGSVGTLLQLVRQGR